MGFLKYYMLKETEEFSKNDIKTIVKQYNKVFARILNTKFQLVNEVEHCTSNGSKLIGIRFASADGYMIRFNYTIKNAKHIKQINRATKEFRVESIDFWNPITGHLNRPSIRITTIGGYPLKYFIEDSVRNHGCQFIISTHSPFLLSLKGARIYDIDSNPVKLCKWTELECVKVYREFFKENEYKFNF